MAAAIWIAAMLAGAALPLSAARAALDVPRTGAAATIALQLAVSVNGAPTGVVVEFIRLPDGDLAARATELAQLRLPVDIAATQPLALRTLPGVCYRYDEPSQTVDIAIASDRLRTYQVDANAPGEETPIPDAGAAPGASLGYSVVAGASADHRLRYSGASAFLDARVFTGTSEGWLTGLVSQDDRGIRALRLDTAATHTDLARNIVVSIGDAIGSGLAWTRPVRLAGVQVQRNFATRPDLVTVPLPSVSGSASVPSSMDVYVNGVRQLSRDLPAGRFEIDNLPAVIGAGTASVVLRDLQGRELRTATPFFVSSQLLRPSLSEFSLEAGWTRSRYGVSSFDYGRNPFVAGSGRIGLSGPLTLSAHGEASAHLLLVGLGIASTTGRFGVVSGAVSGSTARGKAGALVYLSYEAGTEQLRFTAETRRTIGRYFDLAAISATTDRAPLVSDLGGIDVAVTIPQISERVTLSLPDVAGLGAVSAGYAHERRLGGDGVRIASLSYSRAFSSKVSMTASAFRDVGGNSYRGLFVGLSMPLGGRTAASISASRERGRSSVVVDASHSIDDAPGSVGWRVSGGAGERGFVRAGVDYRTSAATLRADVASGLGQRYGTLAAEGVVVWQHSLFFAPRTGGGFAVVDARLPGVPVQYENRHVGRTNGAGLLLVTGVRPFERNSFGIDPDMLPVDATVTATTTTVRPLSRNGVRVRFDIGRGEGTTLLHLVDGKGHDLPMGTVVSVNSGPPQVVGYDGLTPATGLRLQNVLVVQDLDGGCRIPFVFRPMTRAQPISEALNCPGPTSMASASR